MAFSPAETNRVLLGLKEESQYGIYPSGNIEEIRYAGNDSFGQTSNTQISDEIRSDRQVSDIIRTGVDGSGGFGGEISYGVTAFELLLKSVLGAASDFGTPPTALSGEIEAVASGNQFVSDSTGAGVAFTGISVGDWVRASGFTNAANNGYFQVTAVDTSTATAHTITVVGDTLVDEAAATRTIQGSAAMRNGVNSYSFSVEKHYLDKSQAIRFLGYRPGNISFDLTPQQIATYSLSGQHRVATDTAGNDGSDPSVALDFSTLETVTDAASNDIMNTTSGIGDIILNRDAPFSNVTLSALTLNPQVALRRQLGLGFGLGPAGIGVGRFTVAGSLTAYFEDTTLLTEYLRYSTTDIAIALRDGAGNAYLIDVPGVKLGGDGIPKGSGNDQDAVLSLDLAARRSTRDGLDYMFAVHKFAS